MYWLRYPTIILFSTYNLSMRITDASPEQHLAASCTMTHTHQYRQHDWPCPQQSRTSWHPSNWATLQASYALLVDLLFQFPRPLGDEDTTHVGSWWKHGLVQSQRKGLLEGHTPSNWSFIKHCIGCPDSTKNSDKEGERSGSCEGTQCPPPRSQKAGWEKPT